MLLAIAGTLVALAAMAWIAWRPETPRVVVAVPDPPPGSMSTARAAPEELAPTPAPTPAPKAASMPAAAASPGAAAPAVPAGSPDDEPTQAENDDPALTADVSGEAGEAGQADGPAFVETPMQVTRRSNIRTRPTPRATALGVAEVGSTVVLTAPDAVRGYYRIAAGEREGWIWGSNIAAATPPEAPATEPATEPDAGAAEGEIPPAPANDEPQEGTDGIEPHPR